MCCGILFQFVAHASARAHHLSHSVCRRTVSSIPPADDPVVATVACGGAPVRLSAVRQGKCTKAKGVEAIAKFNAHQQDWLASAQDAGCVWGGGERSSGTGSCWSSLCDRTLSTVCAIVTVGCYRRLRTPGASHASCGTAPTLTPLRWACLCRIQRPKYAFAPLCLCEWELMWLYGIVCCRTLWRCARNSWGHLSSRAWDS